jgi:hypothetical protein
VPESQLGLLVIYEVFGIVPVYHVGRGLNKFELDRYFKMRSIIKEIQKKHVGRIDLSYEE